MILVNSEFSRQINLSVKKIFLPTTVVMIILLIEKSTNLIRWIS